MITATNSMSTSNPPIPTLKTPNKQSTDSTTVVGLAAENIEAEFTVIEIREVVPATNYRCLTLVPIPAKCRAEDTTTSR